MNFVFDFGGVLFRWRPAALLQRLFPARLPDAARATAWAREFFQSHGGDWSEFDRGVVSAEELAQRISSRTELTREEVLSVVDAVPSELQPIIPTVELLSELKQRGHRLFYLSNMPLPYAEHLQNSHRFLGWFEGGVFSSHVKLCKPDPAIYELALQRFGVPAETCVFLDDFLENVEAARAAGWHALHFTDAQRSRDEMLRQGWITA